MQDLTGGGNRANVGQQRTASADSFTSQMKDVRSNPEATLGISSEEMYKRRAAASKPYTAKFGTKDFTIESSTRAIQIMSKGIGDAKAQRDYKEAKTRQYFNVLRFSGIIATGALMYYIATRWLLPLHVMRVERDYRMEVRYNRAVEKSKEVNEK